MQLSPNFPILLFRVLAGVLPVRVKSTSLYGRCCVSKMEESLSIIICKKVEMQTDKCCSSRRNSRRLLQQNKRNSGAWHYSWLSVLRVIYFFSEFIFLPSSYRHRSSILISTENVEKHLHSVPLDAPLSSSKYGPKHAVDYSILFRIDNDIKDDI